MEKDFEVKKMQDFLWDAFCDVDAVGVNLDDLLSWPGLHLSSEQVRSVEAHYYVADKWDASDEKVKDIIADATDSTDYDRLYAWLSWTVGDQVADDLVAN